MTRRVLIALGMASFLVLLGLSTRGSLFWFLAWVPLLMMLYGLAAALWTRRTLTFDCYVDQSLVTRGADVELYIEVQHRCPLPVSPLLLDICALSDAGQYTIAISVPPFAKGAVTQHLFCPHVGEYAAGVAGVRVQDIFGFFSFYRKRKEADAPLVVRPQVHLAESLAFSPGDSELESVSRAFEDATMPTDVRTYQQGDELKKVHWKLSMRRRELLVRVYEQPQRPDALLLVDCAPPEHAGASAADIRDAICEAAASVASVALDDGAPVRMPLLSDTPVEISAGKPEDLPMVLDALGRCPFDGTEAFERVLLLETRRLRRTGSTAIVTSRMNPMIADMILRIRRMGPRVRVLLAADVEEENIALLTHRLIRNDVEVVPVLPEAL